MSNRRITPKEHQEILINMLTYIDSICRKNNINYSLIGGSLIGAIRHKGFIPWDDDIDIVLDINNYNKLIEILRKNDNKHYTLLEPLLTNGYPLHFTKLIDNRTSLKEKAVIDEVNNYGVFLDIFCYNYAPDNFNTRKRYFKKLLFWRKCLVKVDPNYNNPSFIHKFIRISKNIYLSIMGNKRILKKMQSLILKYNRKESKYVITNNPVYSFEKEVQFADDILEYIDVPFEKINVKIFKNYDNILKRTFGNYMELPPKEKQIAHNVSAYWKN